MKKLSNEELNVLRKSVACYLDILECDNKKDDSEYNLLDKIYNELVDLTFKKVGKEKC